MNSLTTTSSWTVQKYARSYVKPDQATNFTQPVIRVVIDTRKNVQQLESVRLRVLWEDQDCINAQPYIYEDLELLSFSAPTTSSHSLPLKAMYRDATVGIRYHHPLETEPGKTPGTRRFQVTFASAREASQFIAAIEHVCVCKMSPQPSARPAAGPGAMRSTTIAPSRRIPPVILERPHDLILASDELITADVTPRTDEVVPLSLPPSSLPREQVTSSSHPFNTSSDPPAPKAKDFLTEIRQDTMLYDLSDEELGKVVGEVIREPGFLKLMERLDDMWKIKGLVGI